MCFLEDGIPVFNLAGARKLFATSFQFRDSILQKWDGIPFPEWQKQKGRHPFQDDGLCLFDFIQIFKLLEQDLRTTLVE
jgi:hypothetical protein